MTTNITNSNNKINNKHNDNNRILYPKCCNNLNKNHN